MRFIGDNAEFGSEEIFLSKSRRVLPVDAQGEPLPFGTAGMFQVLTKRKDVSNRVAYAFAFDASKAGLAEAVDAAYEEAFRRISSGVFEPLGKGLADAAALSAVTASGNAEETVADVGDDAPEASVDDEARENTAACEDGASPCDSDLHDAAGSDPACLLSQPLAALLDAAAAVNLTLDMAYDLTGYPFGVLDAMQMQVTESGSGFCHAEPLPFDSLAGTEKAPFRLHIETSEKTGSPDSLQAKVICHSDGSVYRVELVSHESKVRACRVVASRHFGRDLCVREVTETFGGGRPPRVLYSENFPR